MKTWSEFLNNIVQKLRLRLHQRAPIQRVCFQGPLSLSGPGQSDPADREELSRSDLARIKRYFFSRQNMVF